MKFDIPQSLQDHIANFKHSVGLLQDLVNEGRATTAFDFDKAADLADAVDLSLQQATELRRLSIQLVNAYTDLPAGLQEELNTQSVWIMLVPRQQDLRTVLSKQIDTWSVIAQAKEQGQKITAEAFSPNGAKVIGQVEMSIGLVTTDFHLDVSDQNEPVAEVDFTSAFELGDCETVQAGGHTVFEDATGCRWPETALTFTDAEGRVLKEATTNVEFQMPRDLHEVDAQHFDMTEVYPLNPVQRRLLSTYDDGTFEHLTAPMSRMSMESELARCGDGLLRFLMVELSTQEDCTDTDEAMARVGRILEQVQGFESKLSEADESWERPGAARG